MSKKLSEVLPAEDAALLTDAARNLNEDDLAHIMSKRGSAHHNLSKDDINSLTALAVKRINNGQSMFGYDHMNVAVTNDEGPDHNW
ncbi:MAG: hypothetical protein GC181_04065 [Bacteroidetes bacterium]|nr:hypothetical protein [Bacteroidota bacterium]